MRGTSGEAGCPPVSSPRLSRYTDLFSRRDSRAVKKEIKHGFFSARVWLLGKFFSDRSGEPLPALAGMGCLFSKGAEAAPTKASRAFTPVESLGSSPQSDAGSGSGAAENDLALQMHELIVRLESLAGAPYSAEPPTAGGPPAPEDVQRFASLLERLEAAAPA